MTDKVTSFCESVQAKLESLEGRLDCLKLNIGTTWHSLQEKLSEVRRTGETTKRPLTEARIKLEQWFNESKTESKNTIVDWVTNGESEKLAARAQKAEDCAWTAIMIAEASIDDAERMILEAISARLDAEAVGITDLELTTGEGRVGRRG